MGVRRMWVLAGFVVATAGCTSILGDFATGSADATVPDGAMDGATDAPSDAFGGGDGTLPPDSGDASGGDADAGCATGLTACATGCANLEDAATNCGACGHDCSGGSCTASVCGVYVVAAPPKTGVVANLATDGHRVIWSDTGKAAILQIGAPGGTAITLAPSSATWGVVGPDLAFANGTAAFTYNGSVPSVGLAKADVADSGTSVYTGGVAVGAVSLNATATRLFYVNTGGTQSYLNDCPVKPDAGACKGVGDTGRFLGQTAADSTYLLFDQTAANVAQPGVYLDVISTNTWGIFTPDTAQSLAVDGTWAYWTVLNDGGSTYTIHRTLESSPTSAQQTPVSSIASSAFATDGANLYYWTGSSVASFPVAGGAEKPLASATKFVQIAVGGGLLVWTDGTTIWGLVLP